MGVYLPKPVFSHGQLYVAVSRVTSKDGLRFHIINDETNQSCGTKKYCVQGRFHQTYLSCWSYKVK